MCIARIITVQLYHSYLPPSAYVPIASSNKDEHRLAIPKIMRRIKARMGAEPTLIF